ncbi:MAG: hypothetical protein OQK11_01930 [Thiovulaceae bacterium]|nr:hypothetical protein [Sulfurimonadaceae bacterium]
MQKVKILGLNIVLIIMMSLTFSACGSSSSSTPVADDSTTSLTGTAAAGAPIIGHVIVKGANGNRVSEEIEADGTYDVDVSTLTPPYRLRAEGTVGGRRYELHSYATEANLGGTVNITPFTDLIISNAAGQLASNFFDSNTSTSLDDAEVEVQKTALKEKLQTVLTELGVASTVDLLTTSFNADHSELDAALDMVRVEYDTNSSVATLTNLIDNTNITDNIEDTDDNTGTLEVVSTLSDAQAELLAIDTRMKAFAAMITANNFTQTQLEAYLADSFLEEDMSKSEWATDVASEDTSVVEFENFVITDLNISASTANVTFSIIWRGINEGYDTWKIQKINGNWQILGNGEIVEYWTTFAHCNRNQTISGFDSETGVCGINAMVEDNNPNNNNEAGAILSATLDVIRDGEVVANSRTYLGEPDYAPGEVQVFNYNGSDIGGSYWGDWVGDFNSLNYSLQEGDKFRFQLYATALNLDNPAVPSVSGDIVATYYDDVPADPKLNPIADDYPAFSQTTRDALEALTSQGGSLVISVTVPEGHTLSEIWYEAWNQNYERVEVEDEINTASTITLSVPDLSNHFNVGDTITQRIRVYTHDSDGQEYSTFYQAENITVSAASTTYDFGSGDLTGITVYEVYFDGVTKSINKMEFTSSSALTATGLEGDELGNTYNLTYVVDLNKITTLYNGETVGESIFYDVTSKAYFMTSDWYELDSSGSQTGVTDTNYYFNSLSAAQAFTYGDI